MLREVWFFYPNWIRAIWILINATPWNLNFYQILPAKLKILSNFNRGIRILHAKFEFVSILAAKFEFLTKFLRATFEFSSHLTRIWFFLPVYLGCDTIARGCSRSFIFLRCRWFNEGPSAARTWLRGPHTLLAPLNPRKKTHKPSE